MALRSVLLPDEVPGRLWLGPMPGRFEPWATFQAEAAQARLGLVVCLTPRDELAQLSPAYHQALTRGDPGFRWLHVPMRNFGLPEDAAGFRRDMTGVAAALQAGDAVLLHCAAGIGRTGTAAACLLKTLGLPSAVALQHVRDAGSNPETAIQGGLVDSF